MKEYEFNKLIKNYFYKGFIVIDVLLLYLIVQYYFFKESFIFTLKVIKGLIFG
tara:strand:+ start:456 stop:614 length:159 start_codon:yes stop_codon:yes gene_type:complete